MNRLLGLEEFKFWVFDRSAPFNVVASARIAGTVDGEAVRAAALGVARRHPVLRSRVVLSGRPRLVSVEAAVPPMRLAERRDDDHWIFESESEFALAVPIEPGPPWRLALLRGSDRTDLIITISHVIADGTSILLVMRDLFRALRGDPLSSLPELPACEEMLPPESFSSPGIAGSVSGWWSRSTARRLENLDYGRLVANLRKVGPTRLRWHELSAKGTDALITRCRAERTTVQGALAAAMLRAVAATNAGPVSCFHIVGLRNRLAARAGDDVGLFISHVVSTHAGDRALPFWDLARDARRQVVDAIERRAPFDTVAQTLTVLARDGSVDERLSPTVTVSNVGKIDVEPVYGPYRIEQVRMGGAALVAAPLVEATTFAGRLGCLFLFPGLWPRLEEADTVCRSVVSDLVRPD
jgi:hypothetical protein